jgi:hypothetical protein
MEDRLWYVGESRAEALQAVSGVGGAGWVLAVKTPDHLPFLLREKDREEEMLRRAWQFSTETLSAPFSGVRLSYRDFGFRLESSHPLEDATALLGRLVSDDLTGAALWHLAACRISGETLPALSASQALPLPTPLHWASWRVSDHHDRDPFSWIILG